MADDDAKLIAAAKGGDHSAFTELVDRHQQALRGFLRRVCLDLNDVDDIAQDTLIAAWTQLWRYRGGASLRTWLCAIAWRKARESERAARRRRERDAHAVTTSETTSASLPDDALAVRQVLATLPIAQRAAVALCLGGEFTHAEAAAILELPTGTVHSHVARGRAILLERLKETS